MLSKKVVTISGGSGGFTLLRGLVEYPIDIISIATVFDSGGSTGVLRDAYGALPQGDIRRCLLALIPNSSQWRGMFMHRFSRDGFLENHALGNLMLLAAEERYGRADAVKVLGEMLGARGQVMPVSVDDAHLVALLDDGSEIFTESAIDTRNILTDERKIVSVRLTKPATACRSVLEAIKSADYIIIGPGDLYTSLIPNLLVYRVSEAIVQSSAKLIYVSNLMTKGAETRGYSVCDFLKALRLYGIDRKIDVVVVSLDDIPSNLIDIYRNTEHAEPAMQIDYAVAMQYGIRYQIASLFSENAANEGIIRHSAHKLGRIIMSIMEGRNDLCHLIVDLDDTLAQTTVTMRGDQNRLEYLTLVDGALKFLLTFPGKRIILTCGEHNLQSRKLEHLGIKDLFEEIYIVPKKGDKETIIANYLKRNGIKNPRNVIVVGDRVDAEILYGRSLGCKTIRVQLHGGKYVGFDHNNQSDLTITSFSELQMKDIL